MTDCTCPTSEEFASAPSERSDIESANWPAVASLAFGVFGLVTAEFLPASLLTPMALDLGVSAGAAGQAVTATAVVAAIAGPAVVVGTGRIDRRHVVWALSVLLVVSNLVAAFSTNVVMLLIARMALGVALGGFWSLAAALALRLVPAPHLPRAMAVIFTGVSVATVCAAPLGAFLSSLWGWRLTFASAAVCGVVALLAQLATMPRLPPVAAPGFGSFLAVVKRPVVVLGLATVLLVVSAHFAGFTYMRPFLEKVPMLDVTGLSLALLAFGVGGFFGNIAGGALAERNTRLAVSFASVLIALSAAVLFVGGAAAPVAYGATAAWGFAFGAFPVAISAWNTKAAPDHAESAGALLLVAFQVAIAAGAVLGGVLVDAAGPSAAIAYAAGAATAGTILIVSLAPFTRSAES